MGKLVTVELLVGQLPLIGILGFTGCDAIIPILDCQWPGAICIPPDKPGIATIPLGSIHLTGLFIVNTNRFAACIRVYRFLVMLRLFQNGSGWVKRPVLGLKLLALR